MCVRGKNEKNYDYGGGENDDYVGVFYVISLLV
jgi:hypothetical protein